MLAKTYQQLSKINDQMLSMTLTALNDTPDSDTGKSATTLVYVVYTNLSESGPRGIVIQPADIIRSCTKMLMKLNVKLDIRKRYGTLKSIRSETD